MEILEGRQSVLAALQARQRKIQVILIRHGLHTQKIHDVVTLAEQCGVPIRSAAREELDALTHGASHGGIAAVCSPKPRMSADDLVDMVRRLREPALLLLLEGVDDVRNLGFTLRSAESLGAHAVLIKKHLWDFDAGDLARSSSGAYERLPLVQIEDLAPLRQLQAAEVRIFGCLAKARRTIYDVRLNEPALLAIGGEKRGLSGALRGICDRFISIPGRGDPSSLSLSHAAALVLAEAMRQRGAFGRITTNSATEVQEQSSDRP